MRVDVELEPITEGEVIAELERLAVDLDIEGLPERVRSRLSRSSDSPAPPSLHSVPKKDVHRSPHERGGTRFGVA